MQKIQGLKKKKNGGTLFKLGNPGNLIQKKVTPATQWSLLYEICNPSLMLPEMPEMELGDNSHG